MKKSLTNQAPSTPTGKSIGDKRKATPATPSNKSESPIISKQSPSPGKKATTTQIILVVVLSAAGDPIGKLY